MNDQPIRHVGYNYFIQADNGYKIWETLAQRNPIIRQMLDSGDDTIVFHVIDLKNGSLLSELKWTNGCTTSD